MYSNHNTRAALSTMSAVFLFSFSFHSYSADDSSTFELCSNAMAQVQQYMASNRHVAEARYSTGAITAEDYAELIATLDDVETSVSIENCMSTQANNIALYECLNSNQGNYTYCR